MLLVDHGEAVGDDLDLLVVDTAHPVAAQVEIAVVGQVHDGRLRRRRDIVDPHRIVLAQRIGHCNVHRAGKAVLPIGAVVAQGDAAAPGRAARLRLPHLRREAFAPAMRDDRGRIGRQRIAHAVDRETAMRDAIGIAPDHRADGRRRFVGGDVGQRDHDIGGMARPVGHADLVDRRPEGQHAESRAVPVAQHITIDRLALAGGAEHAPLGRGRCGHRAKRHGKQDEQMRRSDHMGLSLFFTLLIGWEAAHQSDRPGRDYRRFG